MRSFGMTEADEYVRAKHVSDNRDADAARRFAPHIVVADFLRDCFSQLEPQKDCYVWSGWPDAVALLGFTEFKPLVSRHLSAGRSIHHGLH